MISSEILSYWHEHDLSQTKTIEDQEEKNPKFIIDYDPNTTQENLIDNIEENDEDNSQDLRSKTMHKTNYLLIDEPFTMTSIVDEQNIISNIESSQIRSISNTINPRSIFHLEGIE